MKKLLQISPLLLLFLILPFTQVAAGDCYADPIYERNLHGKYNISAYVRDRACTTGTNIIETVQGGKIVRVIGETDGWYKVVTLNGKIGWTGARLMTITSEPITTTPQPTPTPVTTQNTSGIDKFSDTSFYGRIRGKLLLQVEDKGRIWYMNPKGDKRYEVTRENAMDLFRNQALGITNENLYKIPENTETNHSYDSAMRNNLRGKILLQVEAGGQTWYVTPGDLTRVKITQDTIMSIFRSYSLGITNTDLFKIERGDITQNTVATEINTLTDSAIIHPNEWIRFDNDGYNFYYPDYWYIGKKDYQPNWTYLSREKDYIDNLNTRNYLDVDTYTLTYKLANKCYANDDDDACLKKGGYYLSGYTITESEKLKINGLPVLREKLYAERGTVVYGNRTTGENETIILYTYRNGQDLYRVQYFNAHWRNDYNLAQFDGVAKTFSLN